MLIGVNKMNEIEVDKAFSDFLDDDQYEKAIDALFELIQAAFTAGWKAALGSDIEKVMKIDKR